MISALCQFGSRTAVAGLALAALAPAASAAPIVSPGSTYVFRLFDYVTPGVWLQGMVFDGLASVHHGDGLNLTMGESQTDNGDGTWRIALQLTSDADMFPGSPNALTRFGHGDALDLLQPVRLTGASVSYSGLLFSTGDAFATDDDVLRFLDPAARAPWTGYLLDPNVGFGAFDLPDWDVRGVTWTMTVQAIPEPAPLALVSLALTALAWARRRVRARATACGVKRSWGRRTATPSGACRHRCVVDLCGGRRLRTECRR